MELYESHLLVIGRAPEASFEEDHGVPQVCLILGEGDLISFQKRPFRLLREVRRSEHGAQLSERRRNIFLVNPWLAETDAVPLLRSSGPGYLAYALLDSMIDHDYPVVERIAHFMPEPVKVFVRDVFDHARQIEGRLDAAREIAVDTMAAILATLGHRQNEIMKVLTLVGSIFIPLTFLAGIYGMNFEHMPELGARNAYPILLGVMGVAAVGMTLFFRHKGWIGRRRDR